MKIRDIIEGKSENRELWDRIKSKGVVPSIDRERYTDMSGEGLEGPFRMKNGQVLYYDPKEGKYYNRDTDMYVDYDDYRAMNEEDAYDKDVKSSNKPHDKEAAAKRAKAAALAAAKKAKGQGVAEGSEIKIPTEDGITMQDIRLMAGEGKLTKKTVLQAIAVIRKQRKEQGVDEAEVGNTEYQWAHGKKPSGHGSWFFVAHRGGIDFGKDMEDQDYIQLHGMSFSDAKKAAIKWAKSKGHPSLFVAT